MRPRILITGPGGRIGSQILPLLRKEFALRLLDAKPLAPVEDDEVVQGDILDFEILKRACQGVTAMVHLAAVSDEDDFKTKLLPVNLEGGYNAFEAAYQAGVPKMIFASSGQTTLMHGRSIPVGPESPVRPYTVYACTKVFGEALARYYVDVRGMKVLVLRIGWFRAYDDPMLRDPAHPVQKEWCSPRDLVQLITRAVRADLSFGIFYGVSNNTGRYWDIRNARELLGYQPEDDAARILARSPAMTPP